MYSLCDEFYMDFFISKLIGTSVSILTGLTNYFVRFFNIYLIGQIGMSSKSEEMVFIMRTVFFATFFNSGVMPLLTNGDF